MSKRKCTYEYYGAHGPCCKLDSIINFLYEDQALWSHIKYFAFCDDDMFWRPDQTLRYLAALEKSGISDKLPLCGIKQMNDREIFEIDR